MDCVKKYIESSQTQELGIRLLDMNSVRAISEELGISEREAQVQVLRHGGCPARYARNMGTVGVAGQIELLSSAVGIPGCGGIGGYLAELLARCGVGQLVLADGDRFTESNLNRQLLCTEDAIGHPKAHIAASRVRAVNSATDTVAVEEFITEQNADRIFAPCCVVADALDSNTARTCVLASCRRLGIPFVHGAIAGYWAQVAVCRPNEPFIWDGMGQIPDKGEEQQTGNPPFIPAFAASLQAAEVIKLITRTQTPLSGRLLWYDLAEGSMQDIKYAAV